MAQLMSPQQHAALALVIETLEGLSPAGVAVHQGPVAEALDTLRQMLQQSAQPAGQGSSPSTPSSHEPRAGVEPPEEPIPWGQLLRQRREAAGLTRLQLATLAGLSVSTLKALETMDQPPTQTVLGRLAAVKELQIDDPADPLLREPRCSTIESELELNCWLAPGFDSIKMIKELVLQVNGRGGYVEQSYLYLDHLSAACWCAIADQEDYVAAQMGKPLDRAANQILKCVGGAGIDVIALGCGDGKAEVRLVQHLAERVEHSDLRFYLLDISQPLLSAAYKHAADTLADRRGVAIFAIQGNFHDLPRYTQLLYTPHRAHRRRVVCMFGYTFGNLQNEILFVRNSLVGFAPGDLLLLDVGLCCAPADQPEEIMRRDPRLAGTLPSGWKRRYEEWLSGPIWRYARDVDEVEISSVLDTTGCPVPGSYAVELRATVRSPSGHEREFSIFRVKRYDVIQLVQCMRQLGWNPVDGWKYGTDPRLMYLFRKA
ncbi:MAG: L-histidine N(alpha)-methyltransferase [Myxococcales bacterium]|nr:L-histidine N(alpha)-methyltransferase [Myxococcota bacterium]MDW8282022.1 L-histidine N(alpha)-methyltransferase [Myxococcales bacterium]